MNTQIYKRLIIAAHGLDRDNRFREADHAISLAVRVAAGDKSAIRLAAGFFEGALSTMSDLASHGMQDFQKNIMNSSAEQMMEYTLTYLQAFLKERITGNTILSASEQQTITGLMNQAISIAQAHTVQGEQATQQAAAAAQAAQLQQQNQQLFQNSRKQSVVQPRHAQRIRLADRSRADLQNDITNLINAVNQGLEKRPDLAKQIDAILTQVSSVVSGKSLTQQPQNNMYGLTAAQSKVIEDYMKYGVQNGEQALAIHARQNQTPEFAQQLISEFQRRDQAWAAQHAGVGLNQSYVNWQKQNQQTQQVKANPQPTVPLFQTPPPPAVTKPVNTM